MTQARLAPLLEDADRLDLALDAEKLASFERYFDLILEWNERAGITSIRDEAEAQHRHFGESLALLRVLRDAGLLPAGERRRLADLGPGGGFPGIPMRIAEPSLELALIESNQKRAEFLEFAVRELGLTDVTVHPLRAEDAGRAPELRAAFDVVVARALAAMPVLVEYALPLLRDGGILAAPKGSRALDELAESGGAIAALGGVALEPLSLPVLPDAPPQTVLLVRREGPLDDRYPRRAGMPSKRPLA
ncbi:MAG: 16S rRNA (guanine(527)-N(7))-methyltransferase RsmG [Dehalococcoidia bacterium]|nr:16S rRNA (guanine(527)-N(7))-methyltransferase RsmG [Dehalococcoidia bacterium]